jgi:hypothetical protein
MIAIYALTVIYLESYRLVHDLIAVTLGNSIRTATIPSPLTGDSSRGYLVVGPCGCLIRKALLPIPTDPLGPV